MDELTVAIYTMGVFVGVCFVAAAWLVCRTIRPPSPWLKYVEQSTSKPSAQDWLKFWESWDIQLSQLTHYRDPAVAYTISQICKQAGQLRIKSYD